MWSCSLHGWVCSSCMPQETLFPSLLLTCLLRTVRPCMIILLLYPLPISSRCGLVKRKGINSRGIIISVPRSWSLLVETLRLRQKTREVGFLRQKTREVGFFFFFSVNGAVLLTGRSSGGWLRGIQGQYERVHTIFVFWFHYSWGSVTFLPYGSVCVAISNGCVTNYSRVFFFLS